jgi:hypothetical protein
MLLAMPGHAKYFGDRMEALRTQGKAGEALPDEEKWKLQSEGPWVGLGDYEDFRTEAFRILGLLPSPETVAVLGHFINDPEPYRRPVSDYMPPPANSTMAYQALANLGIEHPPTRGRIPRVGSYQFDDESVQAWRAWWDEVKSGKRTYRFAGSDVEYGPDGPASGEALARIAKTRQRDGERLAGSRKPPAAAESAAVAIGGAKSFPTGATLAACIVAAAAGWYFLKRRPAE